MALPIETRTVFFAQAKNFDGIPTETPPPGSIELTGMSQIALLRFRGENDSRETIKWYSMTAQVPIDTDTILVGRGEPYILRRSGKITQRNGHGFSFILNFNDCPSDSNQAPVIELPHEAPIDEIDCFILQDGRTFFVNGDQDQHIKLARSLGIQVIT